MTINQSLHLFFNIINHEPCLFLVQVLIIRHIGSNQEDEDKDN